MTRRARQRVEAVGALLAFPVAIALTVLVITSPGSRSAASESMATGPAAGSLEVAVEGGDPVPAYGLADALTAEGYDVVTIDPGEMRGRDGTEVVYYERRHRREALRLRDVIGVGTIRREPVLSSGSDMTIFIGKDL